MLAFCCVTLSKQPVHRIVNLANADRLLARGAGDLRHQVGDLLHPPLHTGNGGLRLCCIARAAADLLGPIR